MEKEKKTENSGLVQGNAEKKPVWNKSCNGDSVIRQVMGASAWPCLLDTTKNASVSNKSPSDSLKSPDDASSSSSSTFVPFSQKHEFLAAALDFTEQKKESPLLNRKLTSASTNDTVAQSSGQSSSGYPQFPLPRNKFASQSNGGTQNQYQHDTCKNYPHQSHGRRHNHVHGLAQPPRGGFAQRLAPPPPPMLPMNAYFYPFTSPMVFHDWAPSMMYHHPHHIPFTKSPPYSFMFQDNSVKISQVQYSSLETKIRNQVHYYFSVENLRNDKFLCKRMNDEGFVHIELIAGFKRLKALTSNIQLIMDALQGSNVVELKGYEIRNLNNWRHFVMPLDLRVTFYPSPEYEMASKVQNILLEPKKDEAGASSSNQIADENNNSA